MSEAKVRTARRRHVPPALVDERYNAAWWPRTARTRCLGCGDLVPPDEPCTTCQVRTANRRIAAQKNGKAA